jgi:aminoglycoside phosphotransferase (APT) family kinase protein
MTTNAEASSLDPALAEWVSEAAGGAILRADQLPGGNRRQAWSIDVSVPGRPALELFLRCDPLDPAATGDPYTIRREAAVYRAIGPTGVAIPRLVAMHPMAEAMLAERVRGSAAFHRLADPALRVAVARDFMRQLALLHRSDAGAVAPVELGRVQTIPEHVVAERAIWERMYRDTGRSDPLIELGLVWLARNIPAVEAPVVLVHGDAGPGNFLYTDGAVTALLDWELAHLGDPMEDLAWLSMRTALEGFPDFRLRLAEYAAASGIPIDRARIRYHRVFVELRIVILRHRADGEVHSGGDAANSLVSKAFNRRLLVEALADAAGLRLATPPPAEAPDTERTRLYGVMLDQLRDVIVPRSSDPLVLARAKSIARIAKYLKEYDRLGATLAAQDLDDLRVVLEGDPGSAAAGRRLLAEAVRDRRIADADVLRYLGRQVARDTQLMAPALGALARRHFPSLDSSEETE